MQARIDELAAPERALKDASMEGLASMLRHWTWADEARTRFERELAIGWEYDEDLLANHPFGSYYHWCALLAGFGEAALDQGLLPPVELDAIRADLEASLPALRACRDILIRIPSTLEAQPRVVDLLHDGEMLGRLGRLHQAFGEAIRREHVVRQIDSLDP
jgi:hypothetical protein